MDNTANSRSDTTNKILNCTSSAGLYRSHLIGDVLPPARGIHRGYTWTYDTEWSG